MLIGELWAREVAALAGVFLPVFPMEHQYLITEVVPEIVALNQEIIHGLTLKGKATCARSGEGGVLGV